MNGFLPPPEARSPPVLGAFFSPTLSPTSPMSHSYHAISSAAFSPPIGTSPTQERKSVDKSPHTFRSQAIDPISTDAQCSTILLRRLPNTMSKEALASMLLFAEDFIDAAFVSHDHPEDRGFLAAMARFRTLQGAQEARNKLNGKPNSTNDATMIVHLLAGDDAQSPGAGKNDVKFGRQLSSTSSASSSNGNLARQPSRYNSTFQSMDKSSPPAPPPAAGLANGDYMTEYTNTNNSTSTGSPPAPNYSDRTRVSGKSVIIKDVLDEETGELLKDPVAYASSGRAAVGTTSTLSSASGAGPASAAAHTQRIPGNPHLNLSRLASLSLNTSDDYSLQQQQRIMHQYDGIMGQHDGMRSPSRNPQALRSPASEVPPTMAGIGPLSPSLYPMSPQQYPRHQYPPANPADQNPPCNTLYVGNLPADTSEDELKAMFSKQRGYKRLCFRTKHNGPMCFVEFDDVSYATKALNELYGHPLHNSVKGGIRLSFSKNPLGVRTGQASGLGPQSPLSPTGGMNGFGNALGSPSGFATANGPPPGLAAPPGLSPPSGSNGISSANEGSVFSPQAFQPGLHSPPRAQAMGGPLYSNGMGFSLDAISNGFPNAFMLGR